MRKLVVSAAAAAILASGSIAFAATMHHMTGKIKSFDQTAMTMMLDNGTDFTLSKTFKDPGLKAGEKVRVSWEMSGKHRIAESAKILK
jgi:hypothetical protein